MELSYTTQKSNSARTTQESYADSMMLFRYPTMTPASIAILIFTVFIITIFGILIHFMIQNSKHSKNILNDSVHL